MTQTKDQQALMNSEKVVIPAQAGIQPHPNQLRTLDFRPRLKHSGTSFRGNDPIRLPATFCETVKL